MRMHNKFNEGGIKLVLKNILHHADMYRFLCNAIWCTLDHNPHNTQRHALIITLTERWGAPDL